MDFHVSVTSGVLGRVLSMAAEKHATFDSTLFLMWVCRAEQRERTTFWIRGLAGRDGGGKGCG